MSRFDKAKQRVVMEIGIGVLEISGAEDFDYYKTIVEALEIAQIYEATMDIINKINNIRSEAANEKG